MNGRHGFSRWIIGGIAGAALLVGTVGITAIAGQESIDETLTIGFIGSDSDADRALYNAAVLAAETINDDDGVLATDDTRYGFEVVYYEANTQSEVEEAYQDAVDADAIAVLGPEDSTLAQGLDEIGTLDIPVLIGGADGESGQYRTVLSADYAVWAEAAADYLIDERFFDAVALVTLDTSSGDAARDAFVTEAGSAAIVEDIVIDVERDDFEAEAESIREAEADALFIWARDEQVEGLLNALDDARWDGVVVYAGGSADALTTEFDLADVFALATWSVSAYDADSQSFVSDYIARWNAAPTDASAAYYDAVSLLAAAVDNSNASVASIASWLTNTGDLNGVQGAYDRAQTDSVRLLQWAGDARVEAAQYAAGECVNCPQFFVQDTSEEDVTDQATLRVGLITTTNGDNQPLGEAIEDAVSLAIREINGQGGAIDPSDTRYTFSLEVYTASTADEVESAIREASDDGVQVLFGPDYNGLVMPNLSEAEGASILQFVSATNAQIATTDSDEYVFQIRATDETLAAAAARYLTDTRDLTRFATVEANTDYGADGIAAFEDVIAQADDAEISVQIEHQLADNEMSGAAERIAASDAQAVVVWSSQPAAAALLTALEALNWDGVFVYGYLTSSFVSEHADSTIELVGPVNWWMSAEDWASRDFSQRYTDRYGSEPMPQSAAYYDAVYMVHQAITESGAEVSDIQSWLLDSESFIGAQGEYTPESYSNGELTRSVLIVSASGGAVSEVSRYNDEICIAYCG